MAFTPEDKYFSAAGTSRDVSNMVPPKISDADKPHFNGGNLHILRLTNPHTKAETKRIAMDVGFTYFSGSEVLIKIHTAISINKKADTKAIISDFNVPVTNKVNGEVLS